MCELHRFQFEYGPKILTWAATPQELRFWAAETHFPLTDASVFERWGDDPDIEQFVLSSDGNIVGYGETWCEQDDPWAELGRLIVDPQRRGRGLGKQLVRLLLQRVSQQQFQEVWVRVFPDNLPAIHCYRAAGFCPGSHEEQNSLNAEQPADYLWMKCDL